MQSNWCNYTLKLTPTASFDIFTIFNRFFVLHWPFFFVFFYCFALSFNAVLCIFFHLLFYWMLLGIKHLAHLSVFNDYYYRSILLPSQLRTSHTSGVFWVICCARIHFKSEYKIRKPSRVYWSFLVIVKYITTAIEVTTKRNGKKQQQQ